MCLSSWVNGKRESVESIINKRTYFDKMIFHLTITQIFFCLLPIFLMLLLFLIWIIFIITIMF